MTKEQNNNNKALGEGYFLCPPLLPDHSGQGIQGENSAGSSCHMMLCRVCYDFSSLPSFSCWDMNDSTALWWVIKGPVVGSIMVSVLGTKGRER